MSYTCSQTFPKAFKENLKDKEFFAPVLGEAGISGFVVAHPLRKRYLLTLIVDALKKSTACAKNSPFQDIGNEGIPSIVIGNSAIPLLNSKAEFTPEAEKILIDSAETLLKAEPKNEQSSPPG